MNRNLAKPIKESVDVGEMARMVELSRARFYQLIGSTFPFPLYQVATRRPFFNAELQQVCLDVRRRNCGIDGKPIMFYGRRGGGKLPHAKSHSPKIKKKATEPLATVLESLHALGLTTATLAEVARAATELYPGGWNSVAEGKIVRDVFNHLRRHNSHDNVAR